MDKEYRILIVEDSPEDAEINVRAVKKALSPCRCLIVETRPAFAAALNDFGPDAVVTDYTMSGFNGLEVIKIVQELSPFTPVIVVTGSINEETAVRCVKSGAADYILKGNVRRLGPSLLSALQQYDGRKRHYETQAALIESEEKYRALFENDPAGDFIAAADGGILACNRAFAAALGFKAAEEAAGLNFFRFCPNPRQREDFLQILGGGRRVEHLAMELVRNDGSAAFARVNAYGVFGDRKELVRIVGFIIDETERRRLEERLAQAQKLESLGTLAGGIAHDFNNILNIILGYLSLLDEPGVAEADASRLAETIRRATERGVKLVSRLLMFARKDEPRFDPVRLSDVVDETVKLARETFPKTIEIRNAVADSSVPLVTADPDQLHQVFLNLLVNARDAMPGGGALSVSGGGVDRRTLASRYPDTEGETYSFIRIEDTGTGIEESILKRIFEPFFTTKQRNSGTGLGLAMVYGIVKKHRGFVDVESEPGRGTAFTVYLPARTDRERPAAAPVEGAAEPEGGGETILLVEDEEALREYLATVLQGKGYRVLVAADGEAAFDLLREHPAVDLVLADNGLPKMDGGELFKRVHSTGKRARMVLMSGFLDPSVKPMLTKAGVTHYLQKPVRPEELLTTLRKALGKKP